MSFIHFSFHTLNCRALHTNLTSKQQIACVVYLIFIFLIQYNQFQVYNKIGNRIYLSDKNHNWEEMSLATSIRLPLARAVRAIQNSASNCTLARNMPYSANIIVDSLDCNGRRSYEVILLFSYGFLNDTVSKFFFFVECDSCIECIAN